MNFSTKTTELNKVGNALGQRLKRLGIETIKDLIFYFPFRYEDYGTIILIKELRDGMQVTVKGKVELIANKRSPRKRTLITEAVVADVSGQIRIIWFGQPFIVKMLKVGDEVYFSGKITSDMFGAQMIGPGYEKVKLNTTHTARIIPIYSLTSGITQKQLRFLMSQVIVLTREIKEWLPDDIRDQADLMPLSEALHAIHFPESQDELAHAERRIKFDELFLLQLQAEMVRQSLKRYVAPAIEFKETEIKRFVADLPWQLTEDQKIVAWEIIKDIGKTEPMNRLLEGDVGSGKTVVAAIAMFNTVLNGYQAVIMAPTEILAHQHYESLVQLLGNQGARVGLLTRSQVLIDDKMIHDKNTVSSIIYHVSPEENNRISKKKMIEKIRSGEAQIIVGTHALLTEDVEFKNLGLAIVDEQHRFGVDQRKVLREKSGMKNVLPHFLSMTATPIPRSFALTIYGDLDLSIIKHMPLGRKPIQSRLVDPHNREKAYAFIREQIKQGRQVFVVCPLIEVAGDKRYEIGDKKSVLAEYEKLSEKIFPDLRSAYLHGKMKSKEKQDVMDQFKNGTIDILVATSVVEVGVDIPNASVMMIEGADRFGLAQLHQFRGRVGRSGYQSYCFVFTDSDSHSVRERLQYFEKTIDGFALAEFDLERRGPGDVYGIAQSGMMNFRKATMKDVDLIKLARDIARGIDFEKYTLLREKMKEWEKIVHLE